MPFRNALLGAAAMLLAPATALAVDYRVMNEDERAISLIEAAVKTDSDGHRETVFFIAFSQPVNGPGTTQVVSSTILFDCQGRYKVGASSTFTATMAPIERGDARYGWRDLVPGSPFAKAAGYACKAEPLPKADAPEVKGIVDGYLARRAAAAPPATAAEPTPPVVEPVPESAAAAAEPQPTSQPN
jgi:hypothetical protein